MLEIGDCRGDADSNWMERQRVIVEGFIECSRELYFVFKK